MLARYKLLFLVTSVVGGTTCSRTHVSHTAIPCPDSASHATLVGTVADEYSGEPLGGARITLLEVNRAVNADPHAHFTLSCIPSGTYSLRAGRIGYEWRQVRVTLPRDTTLAIRVQLRLPGSGPPLDISDWHSVWDAVLHLYDSESRPSDVSHLAELGRLTGQVVGPIPALPPVVFVTTGAHWKTPMHRLWVDSLRALGRIAGTCDRPKPVDCPDTTFTSFVQLGTPRQSATDTVAVAVTETLINPAFCRRHQGVGDEHQFGVYLSRQAGAWLIVRRFPMELTGGVYCGRG